MNHQHQHTHHVMEDSPAGISNWKLAFSATVHCLLGCGLGEVLGMVIGTWLHMNNTDTMILAILLGFVLGFAFGMIPLLRAGFSL